MTKKTNKKITTLKYVKSSYYLKTAVQILAGVITAGVLFYLICLR